MRVTQKGQVTIPKHVRDHLGIKPGSEVEFVAANDHAKLTPKTAHKLGGDRRADFAQRLERARQYFDVTVFRGMDGKEYIDWLRGPREDVDPD